MSDAETEQKSEVYYRLSYPNSSQMMRVITDITRYGGKMELTALQDDTEHRGKILLVFIKIPVKGDRRIHQLRQSLRDKTAVSLSSGRYSVEKDKLVGCIRVKNLSKVDIVMSGILKRMITLIEQGKKNANRNDKCKSEKRKSKKARYYHRSAKQKASQAVHL